MNSFKEFGCKGRETGGSWRGQPGEDAFEDGRHIVCLYAAGNNSAEREYVMVQERKDRCAGIMTLSR